MKKLLVLLVASVFAFAADYAVDTTHSQVEFKIKHLSVSNVKGSFGKFSGSLSADNGALTALNGEVEINSINTNNKNRDEHLLASDYFDAKKFPKAQLKLVKMNGDKGTFALTIRGVTKEVSLEVEIFGVTKDERSGKEVIGLSLDGKINRKDFGIASGTPNVALGEEVKLTIDIEGRK